MICFCDIPLSKSKSQRLAYGDFVIGLTKDWGVRSGLNPVMYVSAKSELAKSLSDKFCCNFSDGKLLASDFGDFWPMLPYLKPVQGFQKSGSHSEFKSFEQEMEWRFVPDNWRNLIESRASDERTKTEKRKQNDAVFHIQLKFNPSDIEIVIVKTLGQRKALHKIQPALRGKVKLWSKIRW